MATSSGNSNDSRGGGGGGGGKIAIVTGANQGLGYALVEALCQELGPAATVYLTARTPERGQAAVAAIQAKGLSPVFHPLDVTDPESVTRLANTVRERHGGFDIFISNAAARITRDEPQSAQVRQFIETNNHGSAFRIIQAFRSLLREGSKFLIVASSFGSLRKLDQQHLRDHFDVKTKTLQNIEATMDDYVQAVMSDKAKELGWPDWINVPSKIGQVASMKILARELLLAQEMDESDTNGGDNSTDSPTVTTSPKNVGVHAVCPGLVNTAASRPWFDDMSHAPSPAEAAVDVVWLATLPPEQAAPFYGELVQKRKVIAWE